MTLSKPSGPPYLDERGAYMTKSLFWDVNIRTATDLRICLPVFTLTKDKPNLINFGKVYVQLNDPTGYKVSKQLLGDYNAWKALLNCRWFLAAKEMWDQELDAKLSSQGLEVIQNLAQQDDKPALALAAAKYLANREYRKDKTIAGRGRPKKEDINREASRIAEADRDVQEDLKRIMNSAG